MNSGINRRDFIKTVSGVALVSALETHPMMSSFQQLVEEKPRRVKIAVLWEPGFPMADGIAFTQEQLQKAFEGYEAEFLSVRDMIKKLRPVSYDLFVNPFGSAFPREGSMVLMQFLVAGGNWVNLGGSPLSVPVVRDGEHWRQGVRQTAFHKKLGITHAFPVPIDGIAEYGANTLLEGAGELLDEFTVETVYELYVRFTNTKDFPLEDGSSGARDAVLQPLVYGLGDDKRRRVAPFLQIDRLQGEFAGGRWIFANFKGTLNAVAVRTLVERAVQGAMELQARPSFACYRDGELPSFTVQFRCPKGDVQKIMSGACRIELRDQRLKSLATLNIRLQGAGEMAAGEVAPVTNRREPLPPGYYQVDVYLNIHMGVPELESLLHYSTGFWMFDEVLLRGGKRFTTDQNFLLRDNQPYPVTGTTYMSSDVHRKFLFEPNPSLWMKDFREMKDAGVNMVRTGIWTGWKNYMLDAGVPNEAAMRSLDAFLLTARTFDIPVLFTLFAFLPEQWGGENPYLDPRSVNAQKEFVKSFAYRYREVHDILWDFINEPSFCSPAHLWTCRPNYDRYEAAAWDIWLRSRFPSSSDEERLARLQGYWRNAADEPPGLPLLDEFTDVNVFEGRRPIKVLEYRLFAQQMFINWVKEMSDAIRSGGSKSQLITVGQDEGGTYDRPNPQFYHECVDFTCNHTWWFNDDLLWDGVMTKSPGKPNLIEETGVMFSENMDGSPWRTEADACTMLATKFAMAFASNGAGFIQWIWNTNCYMKSDNEAAIGFYRADGTAKPELEPFITIARFIASHRMSLRSRQNEDVVMVIPHSMMFSVRNLATAATKMCVRVMHYHCSTAMRTVSEYGVDLVTDAPKLLILPSPRVLSQRAWDTLLAAVNRGSTLLVTGFFDSDEHWLPTERAQSLGVQATVRPVAPEEIINIGGAECRLSFRGEKIHRVEKAVIEGTHLPEVKIIPHGKGRILWSPLPLEMSDDVEPVRVLYDFALRQAAIRPVFSVEKYDPSILIRPTVYSDALLYTLVSECDVSKVVRFTHLETNTVVEATVPARQPAMLFVSRKDGRVIGRL